MICCLIVCALVFTGLRLGVVRWVLDFVDFVNLIICLCLLFELFDFGWVVWDALFFSGFMLCFVVRLGCLVVYLRLGLFDYCIWVFVVLIALLFGWVAADCWVCLICFVIYGLLVVGLYLVLLLICL